MSGYNKARVETVTEQENYRRTLLRIERIQSYLSTAPRGERLKGKICIITGAASLKGIGRASALLYAHERAKHLYLLDYDARHLPELKSSIESKYPDVKVTTIQADAADEEAIKGLCEQAIKEEGQLDVFFANAGWASRDDMVHTTAETFMKSMRINALSVFLAVKYASEAMKKTNPSAGKELSGGSIIVTASVAGLRSGAGPVDYSASKAAVHSIAKTTSYQLSRTGIRVNSISPGLIETSMSEDAFEYARKRGNVGRIGQLNPLGRYGVSEEIANAALFLASDESSYVNGQDIVIDGGLSASHPTVPGRTS